MTMTRDLKLTRVKMLHTLVWAIIAGAIVALYPAVALDSPGLFGALHVIIGAELLTLLLFRGKCPLTHVAARYTDDRRPNFDIFLPETLARYNKEVFTAILVGGWLFGALRWLG